MGHFLDRPVWNALATRHAALAEGGERAKRYPASVVPFAAAADDSAESLRALEALIRPDESVFVVQADEIVLPAGLTPAVTATCVQMVAGKPLSAVADERIERLTEADAAEMLALATLTKPGPFTLRAMALGDFWGVKVGGRLVAMAGERMKQPGYSELSGVCSHPDFRGGGLGRLMSLFVAGRISQRGETPYLHSYETNTAAISLYESIGFELRCRLNAAVVQRAA